MPNHWHCAFAKSGRRLGAEISVFITLVGCSSGGSNGSVRDASADALWDAAADGSADSNALSDAGEETSVQSDSGKDASTDPAARDATNDVQADQEADGALDALNAVADGGGGDVAEDVGPTEDARPTCVVHETGFFAPMQAVSVSFNGTAGDYAGLAVSCSGADGGVNACVRACEQGGGESAWCSEAKCAPATQVCAPPAYWQDAYKATREDTVGSAESVSALDYQDMLVVTDFRVQIPEDAAIVGLRFDLLRKADDASVFDAVVRTWQTDHLTGSNRLRSPAWPTQLAYANYGGPTELWGKSWTRTEVLSKGFGVGIAAKSTATSQGTKAYIDYVRLKIFYKMPDCQ